MFRLGIAPTRRAARQLVSHKHILLNGEICNIPSAALKVGDTISVRDRSKSLESITSSLTTNIQSNDWLEWNADLMKGTVIIMHMELSYIGGFTSQTQFFGIMSKDFKKVLEGKCV